MGLKTQQEIVLLKRLGEVERGRARERKRLDWLIKDVQIDGLSGDQDFREEASQLADESCGEEVPSDELMDECYLKIVRAQIDKELAREVQ